MSLSPLDGTTRLLGDGGASAHAHDHSADAVRLAVRLGAAGVLLNVWVDADGEVVVARSGGRSVRRAARPRRGTVAPRALLADVFEATPPGTVVAVGIADDEAFVASVRIAEEVDRVADLWCRSSDLGRLVNWRAERPEVHLVLAVPRLPHAGGLEREIATMRRDGIDAIELRASDWTAGHVVLAHRFGRYAWSTDADYPHQIVAMLTNGLDVVAGRNVEHLVDQARALRA